MNRKVGGINDIKNGKNMQEGEASMKRTSLCTYKHD